MSQEINLIKIMAYANLITAAPDPSGRDSIYKVRSRVNGFRKKINADITDELLKQKFGIKEHTFDEETVSFVKHLCNQCCRNRELLEWEYERCHYDTEGEVADELLRLARAVYREMYN